jgi:hypothetical protein
LNSLLIKVCERASLTEDIYINLFVQTLDIVAFRTQNKIIQIFIIIYGFRMLEYTWRRSTIIILFHERGELG